MNPAHGSPLLPYLRWLGYGGLIPFAALALGPWVFADPDLRALCLTLLRAYGLAIVSFVGAISWGLALVIPGIADGLRRRLLVWSVVPSLVGFASYALPAQTGFLALVIMVAVALAVDLRLAPALGLPAGWRRLRIRLSLGAISALLIGALASA